MRHHIWSHIFKNKWDMFWIFTITLYILWISFIIMLSFQLVFWYFPFASGPIITSQCHSTTGFRHLLSIMGKHTLFYTSPSVLSALCAFSRARHCIWIWKKKSWARLMSCFLVIKNKVRQQHKNEITLIWPLKILLSTPCVFIAVQRKAAIPVDTQQTKKDELVLHTICHQIRITELKKKKIILVCLPNERNATHPLQITFYTS